LARQESRDKLEAEIEVEVVPAFKKMKKKEGRVSIL
jgi:hypothetical protein